MTPAGGERAAPEHAASEKPTLIEVCTISNSTETILNIADCLAHLPPHRRTDLNMTEAVSSLRTAEGEDRQFDLALIAFDAEDGVAFTNAQNVITLCAKLTRQLVLLADQSNVSQLNMPANAQILSPDACKAPQDFLARIRPQAEVNTPPPPRENRPSGPRRKGLWNLLRRRSSSLTTTPTSILSDKLANNAATFVLQGLAGGVGTTTLSVTLATELARARPSDVICLLDFDLQFGSAASYLNLAESFRIDDAYRNIRALDAESFRDCLLSLRKNLLVFSAPQNIHPYDALTSESVQHLLSLAKQFASVIVIDAPHALTDWTGDLYSSADVVVGILEQQVRCIHNANKLRGLLNSEGMGMANFDFVLNRAPIHPPPDWQETLASLETGLGSRISHIFPDGGPEVSEACDLGIPLLSFQSGNPFRKAVQALITNVAAPSKGTLGHVS